MAETRFKGATLAPWGKRAFCLLMDQATFWPLMLAILLVRIVTGIIFLVLGIGGNSELGAYGSALSLFSGLGALVVLLLSFCAYVAFGIWNYWYLRGLTGRTLASRMWYLRLVDARTGQPIGGMRACARSFLHLLDVAPLGLGFLLPLVTPDKQTIADMLMGTVVVVDERPVPPHVTSWRRPRPAPQPDYTQQPQQNWHPQPQPYNAPIPAAIAAPRDPDPLDRFFQ